MVFRKMVFRNLACVRRYCCCNQAQSNCRYIGHRQLKG